MGPILRALYRAQVHSVLTVKEVAPITLNAAIRGDVGRVSRVSALEAGRVAALGEGSITHVEVEAEVVRVGDGLMGDRIVAERDGDAQRQYESADDADAAGNDTIACAMSQETVEREDQEDERGGTAERK